jgi:hypothetical protein
MRADPTALYDRVSLYRRYGTDARVSNNVLRIPRRVIGGEWLPEVRAILEDMARLRQSVSPAQPVGA